MDCVGENDWNGDDGLGGMSISLSPYCLPHSQWGNFPFSPISVSKPVPLSSLGMNWTSDNAYVLLKLNLILSLHPIQLGHSPPAQPLIFYFWLNQCNQCFGFFYPYPIQVHVKLVLFLFSNYQVQEEHLCDSDIKDSTFLQHCNLKMVVTFEILPWQIAVNPGI